MGALRCVKLASVPYPKIVVKLIVKRKNGFTLVELLVVISIMSILTIITVSQFETARKKARDVQRKADLSSLSRALQMYYTDYGVFPNVVDGIGISEAPWGGTFQDASGYVYMKVMPKENSDSTHPFCYKVDALKKKMALFSILENTADKECDHNGDGVCNDLDAVTCNGKNYFYYITSPNAAVDTTTGENRGKVQ